MIEIKEGIDLDRVIAGLIGLVCTQRVLGSDIEFYVDSRSETNDVPRTFKPSVNLIDAFRAAEATGLFDGCSHIIGKGSVQDPNGPWWIHHTRDRDDELAEESQVAEASTLPLAICAAILKLTGRK